MQMLSGRNGYLGYLGLLLFLIVPSVASSQSTRPQLWFEGQQLILVLANDWNSPLATLQRFERQGSRWSPTGEPYPAVVGRSGLAWDAPQPGEPQKREGDGRSPAGIFPILSLFGDAPAEGRFHMPYRQMTKSWECVDDPRSRQYNRVLDTRGVPRDWKSSEQMLLPSGAYRWGAIIGYNQQRRLNRGSCIFLHIGNPRSDNPSGTLGCTALEEKDLLEVLAWLRPKSRPTIVQLPRTEYERLKDTWGLP